MSENDPYAGIVVYHPYNNRDDIRRHRIAKALHPYLRIVTFKDEDKPPVVTFEEKTTTIAQTVLAYLLARNVMVDAGKIALGEEAVAPAVISEDTNIAGTSLRPQLRTLLIQGLIEKREKYHYAVSDDALPAIINRLSK